MLREFLILATMRYVWGCPLIWIILGLALAGLVALTIIFMVSPKQKRRIARRVRVAIGSAIRRWLDSV